MAASVFDSPLYGDLFPTGEAGRLFSDSAAIRAMLLVEGALAKAQGQMGQIPELSAAAIHRATLEIQIDPGAIRKATGANGVPVPELVSAFRREMNAPEHAQYVHWGATSQDIIDTGLMLRLRQSLILIEADLQSILVTLAKAAKTHAHTPMMARTYGQQATPTSWGAVLAGWGNPLADLAEVLEILRSTSLWVSLSGAAGTGSALGPDVADLRALLAENLGLKDPGRSWHTDRTPILRIVDWMAQLSAILGGMAQTVIGLNTSGIDEVAIHLAGSSSTMPQKQNPVAPSALAALSAQMMGLRMSLNTAAQHQHQRDGVAWFTEWMVLPQIVLCTAAGVTIAKSLVAELKPRPENMRAAIDAGNGLVFAEALSFALAQQMPRPDAQAVTKTLCVNAQETGTSLRTIAAKRYPDLPTSLFDPAAQMGRAPKDALAFAARIKAL